MGDNRLGRMDQGDVNCYRINYRVEEVERIYGENSYIAAACHAVNALTYEVEELWRELDAAGEKKEEH